MISTKPTRFEDNKYKKIEMKLNDFENKFSKRKMKIMNRKKKKSDLSNIGLTTDELLKFVDHPEMKGNKKELDEEIEKEKKFFQRNISKLKNIKKKELINKSNDDFVSYKIIDKKQLNKNKNQNQNKNENQKSFNVNIDNVDNKEIRNMLLIKKKNKELKKKQKHNKNMQIRKQLVDKENKEVTDRRQPNKQILKNKGLVRKRKLTDGNARVHNRQKYAKKMKAYHSQHAKMKIHDNNYLGEKRGINPYIKKSIDIK